MVTVACRADCWTKNMDWRMFSWCRPNLLSSIMVVQFWLWDFHGVVGTRAGQRSTHTNGPPPHKLHINIKEKQRDDFLQFQNQHDREKSGMEVSCGSSVPLSPYTILLTPSSLCSQNSWLKVDCCLKIRAESHKNM